MDLLFHIARSDGQITAPELDYLTIVAGIFGFDTAAIDRLYALHQTGAPSPYQILGVSPDISQADLRRHWKELVRTHHPDQLIADGMPEEFISTATERLAQINALTTKSTAGMQASSGSKYHDANPFDHRWPESTSVTNGCCGVPIWHCITATGWRLLGGMVRANPA